MSHLTPPLACPRPSPGYTSTMTDRISTIDAILTYFAERRRKQRSARLFGQTTIPGTGFRVRIAQWALYKLFDRTFSILKSRMAGPYAQALFRLSCWGGRITPSTCAAILQDRIDPGVAHILARGRTLVYRPGWVTRMVYGDMTLRVMAVEDGGATLVLDLERQATLGSASQPDREWPKSIRVRWSEWRRATASERATAWEELKAWERRSAQGE